MTNMQFQVALDQTFAKEQSDLCLQCLSSPSCSNILGNIVYGRSIMRKPDFRVCTQASRLYAHLNLI